MSLLSNFFPASLDDFVFEGRNQAYGAYQLRQSYNGRMRQAMGYMVGFCALVLVGGAAWQRLYPVEAVTHTVHFATDQTAIPPTYVVEPPKPTAPPAAPSQSRVAPVAPQVATNATFPAKVVKDEVAALKPSEEQQLTEVTPGLATEGLETTAAVGAGAPGGTGTAVAGSATAAGNGSAVSGPYIVVEQMPEFAGGAEALMRYLQSHLRYPSAALAAQAEGRVYVSFVVQADGTIADISIPKGLGYGLDEEAQRVVRQMPAWTPGQQSHHAVPVRFTLPITFKIQ